MPVGFFIGLSDCRSIFKPFRGRAQLSAPTAPN